MTIRNHCWLLALLAVASCGPGERCSLRPDALLAKQRLSMLQLNWTADTLAIVSGDRLVWQPFGHDDHLVFSDQDQGLASQDTVRTVNGKSNPVHRLVYPSGVVLETRAAGASSSEVLVVTPPNGAVPQALLRATIATARVHLAQGIAVGMRRDRFLDLLFQGLSPDERRCLARYHTIVLADPTGEVIEQEYTFVGDALATIHLFKPGLNE